MVRLVSPVQSFGRTVIEKEVRDDKGAMGYSTEEAMTAVILEDAGESQSRSWLMRSVRHSEGVRVTDATGYTLAAGPALDPYYAL